MGEEREEMSRDMTQAQFDKRVAELGFKRVGFLGYYALPAPHNLHVSALNAGKRRRDQLAYLLKMLEQEKGKK
jgi:hypothetical protein